MALPASPTPKPRIPPAPHEGIHAHFGPLSRKGSPHTAGGQNNAWLVYLTEGGKSRLITVEGYRALKASSYPHTVTWGTLKPGDLETFLIQTQPRENMYVYVNV